MSCIKSGESEMKVKECVMCGEEAEYIAPETNEALCEKCAIINEDIKKSYPHKWHFKLKRIIKNET